MSDGRPFMSPSPSFPSLSSASTAMANAIPRPAKRRLHGEANAPFFTPAAESFNPKPFYTHAPSTSRAAPRTNSAISPPADVSPTDPNVFFLHPPFTSFPNSREHPDGLVFALMEANPDWFLDPRDYRDENNTNPTAIFYPSELEPPKGWTTEYRNKLTEMGVKSFPKDKEPRLRCTFCRRSYGGVNGKSMWRRHVYEKHKIPMANRRENAERGRGCTSNKENKRNRQKKKLAPENGDLTFVKGNVADSICVSSAAMQECSSTASGSRLSAKSEGSTERPSDYSYSKGTKVLPYPGNQLDEVPSAPLLVQHEFPAPVIGTVSYSGASQPPARPQTPPVTPHIPLHSSSGVKLSPYRFRTPEFHHSPASLPSDQPWKFPPCHPLHPRVHDLSLGMIAEGDTPTMLPGLDDSLVAYVKEVKVELPSSGVSGCGTVANSLREFVRSPNQVEHLVGCSNSRTAHLASPFGNWIPADQSIAGQNGEEPTFQDALFWNLPLSVDANIQHQPIWQENDNPFTFMYEHWADLNGSFSSIEHINASYEACSTPSSTPEAESPVLRSSSALDGGAGSFIGLGIGLMEPFSLDEDYGFGDRDDDFHSDFSDFDREFAESPRASKKRKYT